MGSSINELFDVLNFFTSFKKEHLMP